MSRRRWRRTGRSERASRTAGRVVAAGSHRAWRHRSAATLDALQLLRIELLGHLIAGTRPVMHGHVMTHGLFGRHRLCRHRLCRRGGRGRGGWRRRSGWLRRQRPRGATRRVIPTGGVLRPDRSSDREGRGHGDASQEMFHASCPLWQFRIRHYGYGMLFLWAAFTGPRWETTQPLFRSEEHATLRVAYPTSPVTDIMSRHNQVSSTWGAADARN